MKFLIFISLATSCIEKSDSSQPDKSELLPTITDSWPPALSEEQLHKSNVTKIKGKISRLLALDSVEQALEEIYFRDQIYRDSINTMPNLEGFDKKRLYQKMKLFDAMNSELAMELLRKSSWPNTKIMTVEAQEALCLVFLHNNTKVLNQLVSSCFEESFYTDSSFSCFMFAAVTDRLSLRSGERYIYGTLRFKKENHSQTEIDEINRNRSKLGLEAI